MKGRLANRAVQISGSSSPSADVNLVSFAHQVVKHLSKGLLDEGATLVTIVGDEPKGQTKDGVSHSIVLYWSLLESVLAFSSSSESAKANKSLVRVICSEKSEKEVPIDRMKLWRQLISSRLVILEHIPPGWNSNSIKRHLQERYSDALVVIGGGAGVEESTHLHLSHGKPVLPLDVPLGSSCEDGTGGAPEMFRWARTNPTTFFPNAAKELVADLAHLKYENHMESPEEYARQILEFLCSVIRPQVFCGRMAARDAEQFNAVDSFFKSVVNPTLLSMGYRPKEITGESPIRSPLLDLEIFREMNRSPYSVVDLTGLRPNCLIELGYVLGSGKKTVVTAMKGTELPFDVKSIPCVFWDPNEQEKSTREFSMAWTSMIDRLSLLEVNESYVGIRGRP